MTAFLKGYYCDILTDSNSRVLQNSGWHPNLIVYNCSVLLAALMKRHESLQGILYLAIGEGENNWDSSRPAPLPTTTRLAKEVSRSKLVEDQILYLNAAGSSKTPTNQLEITTVFKGEDFASDQPLREFGLFGGDATGDPNTGYLIDYVIHPRVDLTRTMTLTRTVRLSFTAGGVPGGEPTFFGGSFGASLPVISIDGIGDEYAAELGENGIYSLGDLARIDPFNPVGSIPQARLGEFRAKARMVMRLGIDMTPFIALAKSSISNILSERPEILVEVSGIIPEMVKQLQEELAVLHVALDNAYLQSITLGELIYG